MSPYTQLSCPQESIGCILRPSGGALYPSGVSLRPEPACVGLGFCLHCASSPGTAVTGKIAEVQNCRGMPKVSVSPAGLTAWAKAGPTQLKSLYPPGCLGFAPFGALQSFFGVGINPGVLRGVAQEYWPRGWFNTQSRWVLSMKALVAQRAVASTFELKGHGIDSG